jgi:LPS O-antigen subunit length determinant protein (WzzB/FepE family)
MQTETEVDFVYLAKTIWKRKLLVVKLTGIAAVAGFLISFIIPDQYTASITFVQEIAYPEVRLNDEKLLAISALAEVAGVDIKELKKARITPQAYSYIFSSIPFREELLQTRLNFGQRDSAITLRDYYTKPGLAHSITDIPGQTMKILNGGGRSQNSQTIDPKLPLLTSEEIELNNILGKQVTLQILDEEYITIRCTLPEAYASAQLTRRAAELLQTYVTGFQTAKACTNLQYIQERHDEARRNLLKIQEELTAFQVGKKQTIPDLKSSPEKLSADGRIAENACLELAWKLEQSKIALNEQTPVFKTINPVTVPYGKTYPNRIKTTALFSFFGFVMAMVLTLGRGFIEETKEKWKR